jgi:hypothetical protein
MFACVSISYMGPSFIDQCCICPCRQCHIKYLLVLPCIVRLPALIHWKMPSPLCGVQLPVNCPLRCAASFAVKFVLPNMLCGKHLLLGNGCPEINNFVYSSYFLIWFYARVYDPSDAGLPYSQRRRRLKNRGDFAGTAGVPGQHFLGQASFSVFTAGQAGDWSGAASTDGAWAASRMCLGQIRRPLAAGCRLGGGAPDTAACSQSQHGRRDDQHAARSGSRQTDARLPARARARALFQDSNSRPAPFTIIDSGGAIPFPEPRKKAKEAWFRYTCRGQMNRPNPNGWKKMV